MSEGFDRDFGEWMTQRMSQLGLRNVDVARALEVSGPAVSLWRTSVNVPDNRRVTSLARILQVSTEEIMLRLGRFPASAIGAPAAYQALISGVQDHGPLGQRLFLAAAEAILAERHRATLEHTIDLLPLVEPGFRTDEGWKLLWCGSVASVGPFAMLILARAASQERTYDLCVNGSWEHLPHVTIEVSRQRLEPDRETNNILFFDAIELDAAWLVLTVEPYS